MKSTSGKSGIRRNLIYSTILTCATYVFPLIVYPYVSRVLGVSNIGLVGFIDSIATYFILLSMMGISIVGVREIAVSRGDRGRLGSAFYSLLSLHGAATALVLLMMVGVTLFVGELRSEWRMMTIGMCKLVFNLFLVEWFFRGLEQFSYITWRTIAIRTLYVVSVFLLVHTAGDTSVYYFLTMTVVVATAAVNMLKAMRTIGRGHFRISMKAYLRPFLVFGLYMLLHATYTTLNTVYLGFVTDDTEVGYYATATKLFGILFSIYLAFLSVLMPRMSALVAEGRMTEFRAKARKSLLWVISLGVPAVLAGEYFAAGIVELISGPGYEGAVLPMRIILPLILISGLEQVVVMEILLPLRGDRKVTRIAGAGAALALVLNVALVGRLGATGSAVVWLACETLVLILSAVAARRLTREVS